MSELLQRIEADLKAAMRAKDELSRETIRMVIAGIKNKRIELGRDVEDGDVVDVLRKALKSRADSAQQYDDAGRPELAAKERSEAEIVQRYLPAQKSAEEIEAAVKAVIEELGATTKADMGKVIKAVMAKHKGEVDGKTVSQLVGKLL